MTLRLKINLIVGALTLLFTMALLGLEYRSMRAAVREEVDAANRVAEQFIRRTVMGDFPGLPLLRMFFERVGRVRSNDIYLYDAEGREVYRSPPSPYKQGRDAPAWFTALVAPPPVVQSVDFPGGRLALHSNPSRAVIDAWDDFAVLASASLGMLVVVNGLVFWLVGRSVRPFPRIVSALGEIEAGRLDATLPPLPGREAAAIASAFNRMVAMLQAHLEAEKRAIRAEQALSDKRELGRWLDEHIEQERRAIARELHDELGQSVTAIRSVALSVAHRVQAHDAASAQAARTIAEESSRLYEAMHGLIPRLTPLVLDNFGLAEALADLAQRTHRSHPEVAVHVAADPGGVPLSADTSLALYRAAQEGLTNALRHGQAREVSIRLHRDGSTLRLDVLDDGIGLPPEGVHKSGHYGLRWIAERAEGLGGQFEIAAALPRGTRLSVVLPLSVLLRASEGAAA
jgi:two-component system sensor histidine kinase UhpB